MPLILLAFPSVPDPIGSVVSITNAKTEGRSMDWTYQMMSGWYQATRSYQQMVRVVTNNPLVGPIQIQQALIGIGAVQGSYYQHPLPELVNGVTSQTGPTEIDNGSFLHSLAIKEETEDGMQWLCTFSYGPFDVNHELGGSESQNGSINPLDSAPLVHWSGSEYEESYPTDINGIPFLNTAGDPLENPPKRTISRRILEFVRNEATYNEAYAEQFIQSTNSDMFLGYNPNQVKCKNITAERIYTSDYGYYRRITYLFEFKVVVFNTPGTFDPITGLPNNNATTTTYGWEDIVLNAGFRQIVLGDPAQILVGGTPITNPVALNGDGTVLNTTWNPSGQQPEPFYLVFNQYPQVPFANLNIPQDLDTNNQ